MQLLSAPIATAEFIALDTETNGLAGDDCELTEVGTVLVGGGELHDRWSSLVRTSAPLRRGIQRFTGITQAMVDGAPSLEAVLPTVRDLLEGRVLVAHNAPFDRRVLRQAFARIGLQWPDPPVICTAALARAVLPLQRQRGLGVLADALGIEVHQAHRALADAETCARVLCALFPRLCANASSVADALALLSPRRRPRRVAAPKNAMPEGFPGRDQPEFAELPRDPGVYLFRDGSGRVLYVGKSVSIRSRARAHFAPSAAPAGWTSHAAVVDYRVTRSELAALVLENRLIKELRPPGNKRLNKRDDRLVYIRCRLDIPFPILEVARDPAAGHAVTIGPLRGRRLALELVEQLDSLFGLRHCGRRLPRRDHPSAYGQMGRCLSPCLGDLDPNLYRRRLDEVLRLFVVEAQGELAGAPLLQHVEAQMRAAAARQHYERAASLRRRSRRLHSVLERLGGVLEATHARPRLLLARHPTGPELDGFWLAGGRLVDWGPLDADPHQLQERTAAALRRAGRIGELGAHVPPDEVDEVRIVGSWLAAHPGTPQLALRPEPDGTALTAFVQRSAGAPEPEGDDRGASAPEREPEDESGASAIERELGDDRGASVPEPELEDERGASALERELDDDRLDLVGADRDL
ncbi:MAG TPA: exonuclease domain-containing protein [Solirubrobacteraceae bacterium]